MRHDLGEYALCLVPKCVVRRVVAMGGKFERCHQLPLEINSQADWNLISSKTKKDWARANFLFGTRQHSHVLGRHFNLVLAQGIQAAKRDTRVRDDGLTSTEQLELIPALQNCTVAGRNVQATKKKIGVGAILAVVAIYIQCGHNIILFLSRT